MPDKCWFFETECGDFVTYRLSYVTHSGCECPKFGVLK